MTRECQIKSAINLNRKVAGRSLVGTKESTNNINVQFDYTRKKEEKSSELSLNIETTCIITEPCLTLRAKPHISRNVKNNLVSPSARCTPVWQKAAFFSSDVEMRR